MKHLNEYLIDFVALHSFLCRGWLVWRGPVPGSVRRWQEIFILAKLACEPLPLGTISIQSALDAHLLLIPPHLGIRLYHAT